MSKIMYKNWIFWVVIIYLVIGIFYSLFRNFVAFRGMPFDVVRFFTSLILWPIDMFIVMFSK